MIEPTDEMVPKRGSDDEYCSAYPADGHQYLSHLVDAAPVRWVQICQFCGRINNAALRAEANPGMVGPCSSTLPDLFDNELGTWCELRHGHIGDHESGPTRWRKAAP